MSPLPPTPGQTVGPFFGYALPYPRSNELVDVGTPGALRLHGLVTDGAGRPIPDALVEIWQADPAGTVLQQPGSVQRDGTFTGWGRVETDREGRYWFRTLEPGPTEPGRPAFFAVTVFARGLTDRLFTRAYLADDDAALAGDSFLAELPPDRRATLLTVRENPDVLRFDIRLQGEDETVFLTFSTGAPGSHA